MTKMTKKQITDEEKFKEVCKRLDRPLKSDFEIWWEEVQTYEVQTYMDKRIEAEIISIIQKKGIYF